jgi:hypothetical protein
MLGGSAHSVFSTSGRHHELVKRRAAQEQAHRKTLRIPRFWVRGHRAPPSLPGVHTPRGIWAVPSYAARVTGQRGASGWRTFGERTVYDNRWVWLGLVDVQAPNGERWDNGTHSTPWAARQPRAHCGGAHRASLDR